MLTLKFFHNGKLGFKKNESLIAEKGKILRQPPCITLFIRQRAPRKARIHPLFSQLQCLPRLQATLRIRSTLTQKAAAGMLSYTVPADFSHLELLIAPWLAVLFLRASSEPLSILCPLLGNLSLSSPFILLSSLPLGSLFKTTSLKGLGEKKTHFLGEASPHPSISANTIPLVFPHGSLSLSSGALFQFVIYLREGFTSVSPTGL